MTIHWHANVAIGLPFQSEVNTGFGILAKTYLDAATLYFGDTITVDNANSPEVQLAKKKAMAFVEDNFTSVKMPVQELDRGFRFWDAVSAYHHRLEAICAELCPGHGSHSNFVQGAGSGPSIGKLGDQPGCDRGI
jgi:hypothetical protein